MSQGFWINGRPGDALDPAERALHYGDGIFETIRVQDSVPQYLERHLLRLQAGCERLGLELNAPEEIREELRYRAQGAGDAVIKLILGRGPGRRGYAASPGQGVTRLSALYPLPEWPAQYQSEGIRARVCELRLAHQPRLAGIKHLNRLEQVLARAEWADDYEEGLMLDYNGHFTEGTMSNLFVWRDATLITPALDHCGVAGVMRAVILDTARHLGLETAIAPVDAALIESARSVFVCNSLIGIWPVRMIETVGEFAVDAVIEDLRQALPGVDETGQANWYAT